MNRATSITAILGFAVLAMALPVATVAQDQTTATSPEGVEWQLSQYPAEGGLQAMPAGVTATMLLDDGEVRGSAGCNSFFGSYQIDGSSISFDENLGRTAMFCEGDAQVVEDAYMAALLTVTSWAMTDDELELYADDDAAVLVFAAPMMTTSEDDIAALIGALTVEVRQLQERVTALEAGASRDAVRYPRVRVPRAPKAVGKVSTTFPDWMRDEFRPEAERSDELNREIVTWADRSDDEEGFNVYARRGFCEPRKGAAREELLTDKGFRIGHSKPVLVESLPADSTSYQPDHAGIEALLPQRPVSEYSNDAFYDLFVSAFNAAGESKPTRVGSYFLTPEFNCP